jgi:hypothetical protein
MAFGTEPCPVLSHVSLQYSVYSREARLRLIDFRKSDPPYKKVEVTVNTVYATFFIYPLFEDVISITTCFGLVEPSSGNIRFYENFYTYNGSVVFGSN